jgi:hypothetical protein
VNNPVEHLSNNQIIGFIDISRDRNPHLLDQTNREGLMHNPAMDDLRRLVRPAQALRTANTEAESIGAAAGFGGALRAGQGDPPGEDPHRRAQL